MQREVLYYRPYNPSTGRPGGFDKGSFQVYEEDEKFTMDYIKSLIGNRKDKDREIDEMVARIGREVALDEKRLEEQKVLDRIKRRKDSVTVSEVVPDLVLVERDCIVVNGKKDTEKQNVNCDPLVEEVKHLVSEQKEGSVEVAQVVMVSPVIVKKDDVVKDVFFGLQKEEVNLQQLENKKKEIGPKIFLSRECHIIDNSDLYEQKVKVGLQQLEMNQKEISQSPLLDKECSGNVIQEKKNNINDNKKSSLKSVENKMSLEKNSMLLNGDKKKLLFTDINPEFKEIIQNIHVSARVKENKMIEAAHAYNINKYKFFFFVRGVLNYKLLTEKQGGRSHQYFNFTNHNHSTLSEKWRPIVLEEPVVEGKILSYGMYSNSRYYPFLGQAKRDMKYNLFLPKAFDYYIAINGKKREDFLIINFSVVKDSYNIIQISFSEFDIGDEIFLIIYCFDDRVLVHTRFEYKIYIVTNTDEEKSNIVGRKKLDDLIHMNCTNRQLEMSRVLGNGFSTFVPVSLKRRKETQLRSSSSKKKRRLC